MLTKDETVKAEVVNAKVKKILEEQGFDVLNQLFIVKDKINNIKLVKQQSLDFRQQDI